MTKPKKPEVAKIKLTKGKFAIVDAEDFEELNKHSWCFLPGGYAVRKGQKSIHGTTLIYMHRQVIGCPAGLWVDHKNNNKLDNRKQNLRRCGALGNGANKKVTGKGSSVYKGVGVSGNRFRARIAFRGEGIHLGSFKIEADAARAYDKKAFELFHEYACLNFPEEYQEKIKFPIEEIEEEPPF